MTAAQASEPRGRLGRPVANAAGERARVGARNGIIINGFDTYFGNDGTPLGLYNSAVRFLDSGAGSTAARLIKQAVGDGLLVGSGIAPNEVAYHWMLAILSGRSLEQLGPDDVEDCNRAIQIADLRQVDDSLRGLDIIWTIVDSVQQDSGPDPPLSQLIDDYASLPTELQEDFQRHLDPLLAGTLYDDLGAVIASRCGEQRMSGLRTARVAKYFEQEPEPPRARTISDPVRAPGMRTLAAVGGLFWLAAISVLSFELQRRGAMRASWLTLLILAAGAVAAVTGPSYIAAIERRAVKRRALGINRSTRYSNPPPTVREGDQVDEARTRFVRMATSHLNEQVRALTPEAPGARSRWLADTTLMKESLRTEILSQYPESGLPIGSLNWLITWRVKEFALASLDGALQKQLKEMRPRVRDTIGFGLGMAASIVGLLYALGLITIKHPVATALVVLLFGAGGVAVTASKLDVYMVDARRLDPDRQDAQVQYQAELAEYQRWVAELANRPSDAEMARWLDFDKLHLKKLIMAQLGLAERDIFSHATLTEPALGSTLARLPLGPPHATKYQVTVFLLTRSGVRQIATIVDFISGYAYNQVRRSFRHEVITSASVHETGVRYDTGSREAMAESPWPVGGGAPTAVAPSGDMRRTLNGAVILRQDFRLALGNGEEIVFLVESPDNVIASISEEDPVRVLDLALDASGIASALGILEAISA